MKICAHRRIEQDNENFKIDRGRKDGRYPYCRKCDSDFERTRKVRYRREILTHLGDTCVLCGFSDARALHVDHVNGHGRIERLSMPRYAYMKKVLGSIPGKDYQLLCANCNAIKKVENDEVRGGNG